MESSYATTQNKNSKLSRTISFSEFPISQKIICEEQKFDDIRNNGLYRRFSCEQIIDPSLKTRHLKVSETLTAFQKDASTSRVSLGPTITTRSNSWLSPITTTLPKTIQNEIVVNDKSRPIIEKAFSCSDIYEDSLDAQFKRLILKPKSKRLPPLPSTPPLTAQNLSPLINSYSSDNKIQSLDKNQIPKYENKNLMEKKAIRSLIPDVNLNKNQEINSYSYWPYLTILLLSICIVLISITIKQGDLVTLCSPLMDFSTTITKLRQRIYGQNAALNELTEFLSTKKTGIEILVLVGGTGVGKSYTANIIKQMTENKFITMEYYPALDEKDKSAYKELAACKCNLVIVDNIQSKDIDEAVTFCKKLRNRANNYCILILLLINPQKINEKLDKFFNMQNTLALIETAFEKEYINAKIIGYNPLETDILDHCILDAAEYFNITLSSTDIKEIRKDLMSFQSGCKGAYAKVQVLKHDKNNNKIFF